MSKKIVMVNFNKVDYDTVCNLDNDLDISSIDDSSVELFREAFLIDDNVFNEKKEKYLLFDGLIDDEITELYKKIRSNVKGDFIMVKLMDNNAEMQLKEILAEVLKEDTLMKRYYYLETLFKNINTMPPGVFSDKDKQTIMFSYGIYKSGEFELEEINTAVTMMENIIKSKS